MKLLVDQPSLNDVGAKSGLSLVFFDYIAIAVVSFDEPLIRLEFPIRISVSRDIQVRNEEIRFPSS